MRADTFRKEARRKLHCPFAAWFCVGDQAADAPTDSRPKGPQTRDRTPAWFYVGRRPGPRKDNGPENSLKEFSEGCGIGTKWAMIRGTNNRFSFLSKSHGDKKLCMTLETIIFSGSPRTYPFTIPETCAGFDSRATYLFTIPATCVRFDSRTQCLRPASSRQVQIHTSICLRAVKLRPHETQRFCHTFRMASRFQSGGLLKSESFCNGTASRRNLLHLACFHCAELGLQTWP